MSTKINCPHCTLEVDIQASLLEQFENEFKQKTLLAQKKIDEALKEQQEKLEEENHIKIQAYEKQQKALIEKEKSFEEQLEKATKQELLKEKKKLQSEIKKEIESESKASIEALQEELEAKSEQVKAFHLAKVEIEKLKREKEEVAMIAEAKAQVALNEELRVEKERLKELAKKERLELSKQIEEENELKLKAKDEQLEQIKRELDNAQRKMEQGSMQIQGEALELIIEQWLASQFPFDTIEEIKKGAFGADCMQVVHTREMNNCGIICYESKNAKNWSNDWIPKLKQDMLSIQADIGVLVTTTYPKEMSRMGFVDGIWVCSLDEFKGSSSLLRESLIRLHLSLLKNENRADKMSLLYSYMTGNEFMMQMTAIVEGFTRMKEELEKEKRSLMASWKRREKTIEGVLQNTTQMYGALQGIAGASAIGSIPSLDLLE